MLFEFSREQRELPWQPNWSKGSCHGNQIWAKISQNCTDLSSVQDIETIFACMIGFLESWNSNMLPVSASLTEPAVVRDDGVIGIYKTERHYDT